MVMVSREQMKNHCSHQGSICAQKPAVGWRARTSSRAPKPLQTVALALQFALQAVVRAMQAQVTKGRGTVLACYANC
jgi:hypothetical protein